MRTGTAESVAGGVGGSAAVEAAVGMIAAGIAQLERASSASGSQGEWLAVVGACQRGMNQLAAVQDVAVAAVARVERVWSEDGTVGEVVHGPGRVALDAADLLAPLLGASHHRAQARVEEAVRFTGRVPVPVEARESPARSGLGGVHAAMRAGRLDAYRASVVAAELAEAPAEVARAVVAALEPYLGAEAAPGLRRRTRRLLARVCPDLLIQRAARARADTGLRRWVSEPGVDTWHGTFPTEDSATAWAAVDALAHRYVLDGTCTIIDQARGKALTDLVTGNADVTVQVVLTVPAATTPGEGDSPGPDGPTSDGDGAGGEAPAAHTSGAGGDPPDASAGKAAGEAASDPAAPGQPRVPGSGADLVAVTGSRPSEPVLVPAAWLAAHTGDVAAVVTCHPGTGARLDPGGQHATAAYRPGTRLAALVRARDGRCRFPGCSVAARLADLDHVRPWPAGPTDASNLLTLCRRHHRIKQAPGWTVRLHPDGRAAWTDPTGRTSVTDPLDALDTVVLHPDPTPEPPEPPRRVGEPGPGELPSVLEDTLDHHCQVLEVHAAASRKRTRARVRARGGGRAPGHGRARDIEALLDPADRPDRHHLLDRCRIRDGWLVDVLDHRRRPPTPEEPPF
jgi:hypothetical protein